jgi:hypothetical protein
MAASPVARRQSVLPSAVEHSPEKRTVAKFAPNDKTGHII